LGSLHLKKMPPMPVTLLGAASLFLSIRLLKANPKKKEVAMS